MQRVRPLSHGFLLDMLLTVIAFTVVGDTIIWIRPFVQKSVGINGRRSRQVHAYWFSHVPCASDSPTIAKVAIKADNFIVLDMVYDCRV